MFYNLDEPFPCFRGESLDNLDSPRASSWRQSPWLNQPSGVYATSSVQDFSRPPPQLLSTSNRAYMRNPSSGVPPPSAGSGKTTTPSPILRSHSPAVPQPGCQPRNRWGPLGFPSSSLRLKGLFFIKNFPKSCPRFPMKKEKQAFLSVSGSVFLSQISSLLSFHANPRAFMDVLWSHWRPLKCLLHCHCLVYLGLWSVS